MYHFPIHFLSESSMVNGLWSAERAIDLPTKILLGLSSEVSAIEEKRSESEVNGSE